MAKVLIIINSAGLILNVLVFFLVVHYFSGPPGASPAGIGSAGASAPALSATDLDRELNKRFARFDSTLAALSRKVDNLSGQLTRLASAAASPVTNRPGWSRIEPVTSAPEKRSPGPAEIIEEMPAEDLPEQPAGQEPQPVEGQVPDPGNQQPVEEPLPEGQGLPGQPQQ